MAICTKTSVWRRARSRSDRLEISRRNRVETSRLVSRKKRDVSVSSHVSVFEIFSLVSFDFISPRRLETRRVSFQDLVSNLVSFSLKNAQKTSKTHENSIFSSTKKSWFFGYSATRRDEASSRDLETKTRRDVSRLVSRLGFWKIGSCRLVSSRDFNFEASRLVSGPPRSKHY